jgi:hypothetical protein
MSTLKTNNIEHLDASTPSIQTTIGGGTILAGVSTVSGGLNVGSGTSISSPATNTLTLGTNSVERLRIDSAGNIGVGGLTNPGALLSIPAGESNTPRLAIESAVDDNDFTITQYEDGNGTYTMLGQNVKLNVSGNTIVLDSGHKTAGILLDARSNGNVTFYTGGDNASTEKMRIDSSGRVLINQTSVGAKSASAPLQLISSSTGAFGLNISMRSNNDYGFISYTDHDADEDIAQIGVQRTATNTGDLIFYTNGGNASASEELRILSSGGITFNGDSVTANALDDYEEGTWTPAIASSGYALSTTSGYYTKIGNLVSLHCQVRFSAIGSNNASASFTGLPYVSSSVFHHAGVCRESTAYGDIFVAQVSAGNADIAINSMDGVVNGDNAIFATGRNYNVQVTYFV